MKKGKIKAILINAALMWLPLASVIFILCGFTYLAVQQNYRMGLNDPQVQMVTDAENALMSGKQPADVVPRGDLFDLEKSLTPFIAIYDSSGIPMESTAYVDGKPPQLPMGVLQYAREHGENRVTWQPNANTRVALVIRSMGAGRGWLIVSGRNMREVESRIDNLTKTTLLALSSSLVISFALYILVSCL